MSYENIADECFAYPSMRKYPIYNKETAFKSATEFALEKKAYGEALAAEIDEKLEKAASFYGFERPELQKTAGSDEIPCLVFHGRSSDIKMTELRTSEDILSAADAIITKRASARLQDLEQAAKYVLWCAANSDLDINSPKIRKIARIACVGVGDREKIQNEFEKRASVLVLGKKEHEMFWKYAKEMENLSDDDFYRPDNLQKIAEAMEDIDERFGGPRGEDKELGLPEDTVFEQNADDLTSEAEDLLTIPSIDTTISKQALQDRAGKVVDFFNRYLGKSLESDDGLDIDKVADTIKGFDSETADKFIKEIDAQ